MASGADDGNVRIWGLTAGVEIGCLQGHTAGITALCLLPDGHLASGSDDNTIYLWDWINRKGKGVPLRGHSDWITGLCRMPGGGLASSSADGSVRLWNVVTTQESARLQGHSGWVPAICAFGRNLIASASTDHTIRLWGLAGKPNANYRETTTAVHAAL